MASVDKIYGTREQWIKLHDFLEKKKPEYLGYLYPKPPEKLWNSFGIPISNFSYEADCWLKKHCPLEFVQERLKEQYATGIED